MQEQLRNKMFIPVFFNNFSKSDFKTEKILIKLKYIFKP